MTRYFPSGESYRRNTATPDLFGRTRAFISVKFTQGDALRRARHAPAILKSMSGSRHSRRWTASETGRQRQSGDVEPVCWGEIIEKFSYRHVAAIDR